MIKTDYIHWNITKSYCIWLHRFHSQICVHFKPQTIWKFPNSSSSSLQAGKTWGHFWGGNRRLYKFCLLGNRYSYLCTYLQMLCQRLWIFQSSFFLQFEEPQVQQRLASQASQWKRTAYLPGQQTLATLHTQGSHWARVHKWFMWADHGIRSMTLSLRQNQKMWSYYGTQPREGKEEEET